MTWHVDADRLDGYADGSVSDVGAWSLEAHLTACEVCRARLDKWAGSNDEVVDVDDDRLDAVWSQVSGAVRAAGRPLAERLLVRLGVSDHDARLVAATPTLTRSWLLGVVLVLALSVLAAWATDPAPSRAVLLFLLVAPLVPVAGVGLAFGPRVDPTYELAIVAPMRSSRLLLLRTIAVLASSMPLAAVAALALSAVAWTTVAWILPAFALTAAVLAASARWHPLSAAAAIGVGWIVLVVTLEARVAGPLVAFSAAGQATMIALLVVSSTAFAVTRERIDPAARP